MSPKIRTFVITLTLLICALLLCAQSASADQTNDSDKYTFQNYGGEVYTPEPMEFGANLNDNFVPEYETERKHMMLQFYENTTREQFRLLDSYVIIYVRKATDYTFIYSMPVDMTAADLPAESGLRWMGEIPVENKYDYNYGLDVPEWARTENGDVKVEIHFYEDVTLQYSTDIMKKYFDNFSSISNSMPWYYKTLANETNISLVASEDAVESVGYYGAGESAFGSNFVDYEVISEEDKNDSVDDQEDEVQETTEIVDEPEEKESPGFTSTIIILIFALTGVLLKRK